IVAVMAVGAFGLFFLRKSVDDYMIKGDQYTAEGNYELAVDQYSRALRKDPTNLNVINKYIGGVEKLVAKDKVDAVNNLFSIIEWRRKAMESRPNDDKLSKQYYVLLVDTARELMDRSMFQRIIEAADARIKRNQGNTTDHRYRGIAQMELLTSDLPRETQLQTRDDLEQARDADEKDAEVLYYLARWHAFEASRLREIGAVVEEYRPKVEESLEIAATMVDTDPTSPTTQFRSVELLIRAAEIDQQQQEQYLDTARTLVDELEKTLLANPEPDDIVLRTANVLLSLDREIVEREGELSDAPRGYVRAAALLDKALEADPENSRFKGTYARILKDLREIDQSLELYEEVRQAKIEGWAVDVLRSLALQTQATGQVIDLKLMQSSNVEAEKRKQLINEARKLIEKLKELDP
ncbi:MAG: tetratricopeptide repeat protein, partial [Rhodospirillales bacterium]|nr:tetratricopeptide repeat protein [Rhodospirillales bacterium]